MDPIADRQAGEAARERLGAWLETALEEWLDDCDDAIAAMGERAEESALQTAHFNALRHFRRQRDGYARAVFDSLADEDRPRPSPDTETDNTLEDLRGRAKRWCRRYAAELELPKANGEALVALADRLCDGLAPALADEALGEPARMALGKRFEKRVLRPLPEALLTMPEPEDWNGTDASLQPAPADEDSLQRGVRLAGHLLGQLRGLVGGEDQPPQEVKPAASDAEAAPPASREAGRDEVLAALSVLQARSARGVDEPAGSISEIKQRLLEQVERLSTAVEPSRLSRDDEAALELLHLIFDFIGRDQKLSPLTESMLQRLRIPYLKAAVLDPEFFAQPSHPARALLDELTAVAGDWSEHADRGDELHEKISEVVQRILTDFEDDFGLFEPLLASFRRYGQRLRRAAEVDRRKAARLEEGRERIREARTWAARAIGEHTRDARLPVILRDLLRGAWVHHMTLIWLRHGPESAEWQQALQLVDDLLWCASPKQSTADVARLQSMLPSLARQLGAGFRNVAFTMEDSSRFFRDFRELLREQVAVRYRNNLHLPESFARRASFGSGALLQAPGSSKAPPVQAGEQDEAVWIRAVRGLQPGTWVQFRTEDGATIRAKLSWINPVSHKLLFVDANGVKLADKSDVEFAGELRRSEASILENIPLFERAMGAIAEQLRTDPR